MKPRIFVPIALTEEKLHFRLRRAYLDCIIAAGGLPVVVPVTLSLEDLRTLFEQVDGVLLTGGADVDPVHYGQVPHPATYGIDPDRDRTELALVRWAVTADKPLLGLCRGLQVLNVALGGTLIQDIPSQCPHALPHDGEALGQPRTALLHEVTVQPNSRLAALLKQQRLAVNSLHHQAIDQLAPTLVATAHADDGLIEAVEVPTCRFVLGVQWHPEELAPTRPDMHQLFAAFVEACRLGL
ncbi:gamma-glutamyl-gamma-aminobutyrate hydrolase family protein [Rhodothermus bifroesti]|uniref:gamma-glutamyl-gamma-aminobutyrate hydrolase n=1 Tax=Rhodothermus marinus TaxID=29549 RepID=A0A7V2AYT4_RHOMR|nr:gamma-glutamyl-gamma-aminobutyrate hydrolase family protein [Rhodothermus bifroesti]GBD00711.1 Putative glutamine amidotransferase [bacterium HR18]